MNDPESLRKKLEVDPGNSAFVEYAEHLRAHHQLDQCILTCLAGLSSSPRNDRGRLLLARALFERGFVPFAAQEVAELHRRYPQNTALEKLFSKLVPDRTTPATAADSGPQKPGAAVFAEADFSLDELEMIEQGKKK